MKIASVFRFGLSASLLFLLACSSSGPDPLAWTRVESGDGAAVDVRAVGRRDQCGRREETAQVQVLKSSDELRSALDQSQWSGRPEIDFNEEWAVLVHQGLRPTLGYGVMLASQRASVVDGVAMVRIEWRRPDPGSMVGQATSSPCTLLAVTHDGVEQLLVVDQRGETVGQ